jgi:hypothetical protein
MWMPVRVVVSALLRRRKGQVTPRASRRSCRISGGSRRYLAVEPDVGLMRLGCGAVPQRLALIATLHLGLGFFASLAAQGHPGLMTYYFQYLGPAYLLSFSFLEWALTRRVRRTFQRREPMRDAWTMIMARAGASIYGDIPGACRYRVFRRAHARPALFRTDAVGVSRRRVGNGSAVVQRARIGVLLEAARFARLEC